MFGCEPKQVQALGLVLNDLSKCWRQYLVGQQGFLPFEGRMGIYRQPVAWGDQDSMVSRPWGAHCCEAYGMVLTCLRVRYTAIHDDEYPGTGF